jgi:hypothetical protein
MTPVCPLESGVLVARRVWRAGIQRYSGASS